MDESKWLVRDHEIDRGSAQESFDRRAATVTIVLGIMEVKRLKRYAYT